MADQIEQLRNELATMKAELDRQRDVIRTVCDILTATKDTFRSKQVERARVLLAGLIGRGDHGATDV